MEFTIAETNQDHILSVTGEIDIYSVGLLKNGLGRLLDDAACRNLVIDMAKVSYMDSSGIGLLIMSQKKMQTKGGKLKIVNVKGEVYRVLKLSGLDRFFTIADL